MPDRALRAAPDRRRPWRAAIVLLLACGGCARPAADPPPVVSDAPGPAPAVPPAPVPAVETPSGPPWFVDVTTPAGIAFLHRSGDSPDKPFPSANGSGLASLDFDLDGRHDLVFVTGTPIPAPADADPWANHLYRNQGDWAFRDVTRPAGLRHAGYLHGAAVGDFDADGFPDLFLTGYGGDSLLHNRGDGTFAPVDGAAAGIADGRWSSSAAFFDADGDGLLDVYVCRYGKWSPENAPFCGDRASGVRSFCSPLTVEPEPDVLHHNRGDGTFAAVTAESGLGGRPGRALAVIAAHLDADTHLDLYVANDMNPNSLWSGGPGGAFVDSSDLSGTAYDHEGRVKSSMGIDVADTRNRGTADIMVTDFQGEANLFFTGSGDGIFRDVSQTSGAGAPSLPFVSWGVQFGDFDLDGWEDAIVANGHVGDDRQKAKDSLELRQLPLFLANAHGHFKTPPRVDLGPYFTERHQGRGVVAADLDNDGDLDLAFNHRDEPAAVLRNDRGLPGSAAPRRPLVLRLVGRAGNRDAVGALVTLTDDDGIHTRQVTGGGGYQSSRDRRVAFAPAPGTAAPEISIRWPGGRTDRLEGLSSEGQWLVVEPAGDGAGPRVVREEPPR